MMQRFWGATVVVCLLLHRVLSQQCYNQPNCAGIAVAVSTAKECCIETNDGMSVAADNGTCIVSQCVVHGFASASYDVEEGERLDTVFKVNVKGTTANFPNLKLSGTITSAPGPNTRTTDFEALPAVSFADNITDIHLSTTSDVITLEYNDSIILTFSPFDNIIWALETAGEFLRDTATVNIIDEDLLEISFEEADYSIREGDSQQPTIRLLFRRTQNPFTISLFPVSITEAVDPTGFNKSDFIVSEYIEEAKATPGEDFIDVPYNITIPATEEESNGIFMIPDTMSVIVDDDIDEIKQSFALVAQLGSDVPDSFTCFQKRSLDTECFGRCGVTVITIVDDDDIIIGFSQRRQTVMENDVVLSLDVHALKLPELDYKLVFRHVQSSSTAIVESFTPPNFHTQFDARFGLRQEDPNDEESPLEDIRVLWARNNDLKNPLLTAIVKDFIPEEEECYTIRILSPDTQALRKTFACNEDFESPRDFFCLHTICIEDDDEPFEVGFVQTTFTVNEDVETVEVCVILTKPLEDIGDERVTVEVFDFSNSMYIPLGVARAAPDPPNLLTGMYDMIPLSDYEQQLLGFNRIRNTVINETNRAICYSQLIYDDMCVEESEYLGLTLAVTDMLTAVATDVRPMYNQVAIQILDNDMAVVGLESTLYMMTEDVGLVEVCAIMYSPNITCPIEFPFNVYLLTSDSTAVSPMDYIELSTVLNFPACGTRQCVNVGIVNDLMDEPEEEFGISLEKTPDLNSGILLDPVNGKIFIEDNDRSINSPTSTRRPDMLVSIAAAALVIVLLTVIVMIIIYICIKKKRLKSFLSTLNHTDLENDYSIVQRKESPLLQQLRKELKDKRMIVSKDQINLTSTVGQGQSGLVYKGYMDTPLGSELVAVKTGKALFSSGDLERLSKEISTMLSFEHPNIMSLVGVCLDGEMPLLIMPFMSNGNILEYVRRHKQELLLTSEATDEEIQSAKTTYLRMCHQITKGMSYLAKEKFVHRDLAARNCMIDGSGVIKVADFGLTEDMYGTNYFRKKKSEMGSEEKVPIRWMAPESIEKDIYNESTDVWAFGVTVWELFTCGRVPYSGISVMSVLRLLKAGQRLDKPENTACSNEIYDLMTSCWNLDSHQRPTFENLQRDVSDILEAAAGYMELSHSLDWMKEEEPEDKSTTVLSSVRAANEPEEATADLCLAST